MKLPNWFRIVWWVVVTGILTMYLAQRYPDLRAGHSVPVDVVVFLIWVALLLLPLFSEISLFGLKFKQQIESLRQELKDQVQTLRSEIQNTIQFNPNITIAPTPPPDSQLPQLEQQIRRILDQRLKEYGAQSTPGIARPVEELQNAPEDVSFLFGVRYSIEKELRRVVRGVSDAYLERWTLPRLLDALIRAEVIDSDLAGAIRKVYAVCSPAVHGQEVSPTQLGFVREVAPELLATLKRLRETAEMQLGPLSTANHPR